jgi:hypothetical protein
VVLADVQGCCVKTESRIQAEIRQALNASGRARLLRNSVGYDAASRVTYGLGVGSPDLVGTLRSGTTFAVEVKAARGALRDDQWSWWLAARKWGVLGGVARSVEEAMALLEDAERGRADRIDEALMLRALKMAERTAQ